MLPYRIITEHVRRTREDFQSCLPVRRGGPISGYTGTGLFPFFQWEGSVSKETFLLVKKTRQKGGPHNTRGGGGGPDSRGWETGCF